MLSLYAAYDIYGKSTVISGTQLEYTNRLETGKLHRKMQPVTWNLSTSDTHIPLSIQVHTHTQRVHRRQSGPTAIYLPITADRAHHQEATGWKPDLRA